MRYVIKVGTSTLTHSTGKLNIRLFENFCKVLSDLQNMGNEIILVSSGAVAMGLGKIGMKERPKDTETKQAVAAVGQCELMYTYDMMFKKYGRNVAQILVTASDFRHEDRYENFNNTINKLLEMEILPIINENDTIAVDEIKVGDNDTLSAFVAVGTHADRLIILSDIDGFYDADPRKNKKAKVIPYVEELSEEILSCAGGEGTDRGTGGMKTKLNAAKMVMEAGSELVIMNGKDPLKLYDLFDGKSIGTLFKGKKI